MSAIRLVPACAGLLPGLLAASLAAGAETLEYGRFGTVSVTRPAGEPRAVAVLASDAAGPGALDAALTEALRARGTLVLGVDAGRLWRQARPEDDGADACTFIGWDFEAFAQYAEKTLGLADYRQPLLVGSGLGAQLVWAAAAQSTINTFRGVLTLGFDPAWSSQWPLCDGDQGRVAQAAAGSPGEHLVPPPQLRIRWTTLRGGADGITDAALQAFVAQVPRAHAVTVPDAALAGVPAPWLAPFADAWEALATPAPTTALADLPLIELPAQATQRSSADWLAVILSGDGGWADIDRELGERFQAAGIPVVGFNMLKYLWRARSPEEAGRDLERVLAHYRSAWDRRRVLLVGYSLGADILPFAVNRMSPAGRDGVALAALLAPSRRVEFEFHPWDWIGASDDSHNPRALPVAPELLQLAVPALCVYGVEDEDDTACVELGSGARPTVLRLPGGHHFDENYRALAERVLDAAQRAAAGATP